MTKLQRAKEIAIGVFLILISALIIASPKDDGYELIIFIFGVYFTIKGLSSLFFFATMARHMVGGRTSLYNGVIMLNLGLLTITLTDVSHYYIMLYLIVIHLFSGAVDVLRAMEARRVGAGAWKMKLSHGMINISMALICIIFIKHSGLAIIVYCVGLIYSSVLRIVSACRKTKMVYIQ